MIPSVIVLILLALSAIFFIFFHKGEQPKESEPPLTQIENDFIKFAYETITKKLSKEEIQEAGKEELIYFLDTYFHSLLIHYAIEKRTVFVTNNISRLKSEIVKKFFENEPVK